MFSEKKEVDGSSEIEIKEVRQDNYSAIGQFTKGTNN
jgi:hypothetical protein